MKFLRVANYGFIVESEINKGHKKSPDQHDQGTLLLTLYKPNYEKSAIKAASEWMF
ncbi:MAG: hypothetical protein WDZ35_10535 [Crocinitomicaceae bacterium]